MTTEEEKDVPDLMDLGEFKTEPAFEWNEPIAPIVADSDVPTDVTEPKVVTPEPLTQTDWLLGFNKSFNANYASVDEVKSILDEFGSLKEKVSKIDNYDTLIQEKEKIEKTRDLLIEKYGELKDPKAFFADEIEYKQNQLVKSNPTVNREVARKAFEINVETASPLDIIALSMQLTHSKLTGGEIGAKEAFLAKNGIDVEIAANGDVDLSELSRAQVNLINLEAEEAARNIVRIRDSVQLPEPSKDVKDLIEQWMAEKQVPEFDMKKWDGHIDTVVKGVDVFEVKEGDVVLYTEPIDAEFREGLGEAITEAILKGRIEPTKENINAMIEEAKTEYLKENVVSIVKRLRNQTELQIKESVHNKLHNDADPDKMLTNTRVQTGYTTPLNKVLGIR